MNFKCITNTNYVLRMFRLFASSFTLHQTRLHTSREDLGETQTVDLLCGFVRSAGVMSFKPVSENAYRTHWHATLSKFSGNTSINSTKHMN